jgi:catechol 2,3-dioxygenase-like lactoylglutathione lyase family enzyme
MRIAGMIPQLRTTDLAGSIDFYTTRLGMELVFRYSDFYAGIRVGTQVFHLKLSDDPDPSIPFVHRHQHFHLYFETPDIAAAAEQARRNGIALLRQVHDTDWGTSEFAIQDDQGHVLYFGQPGT